MTDKFWYKVARTIIKAGVFPVPISATLIEILQTLLTEEQAKFVLIYRKPSMTLEQIKQRIDMDKESILKMLDTLMQNGVIVGTKSRSTGVKVYRLMGLYPGIFEYTFLKGTTGEKEKKLAELFEKLFVEITKGTQKNYDNIINVFRGLPATDRTLPVEKEVEVGTETVMPFEEIKKYVEEYDDIALVHCYCRHAKDLINDPCKLGASKNNCFLFDKTAVFGIEQGFGRPISKKEVIKILREAEDEGLVHKVFHVHSDTNRGIEAICNCCNCCCGMINLYYRGAKPIHTMSSYIANVDNDLCIGCGTCVEKCPMETIDLEDTVAVVNEDKCIGCGVCAYHCPEEAMHLKRIGPRHVFIPPKKVEVE
ncbi:MAG: 4Fe-4S binding protein [Promethearchaeota archaeon]|nr:MAG: 4Fe-4S binding protein [Candidatus Lokiarchaeota archaeon]